MSALAVAAMVAFSCNKDPKPEPKPADDDNPPVKELHQSLKGSDYAILCMDDETFASIENKVSLDLRNNGDNCNWYDWVGNIVGRDTTGANFYGVTPEHKNWYYLKLMDISAGWSGGALNVTLETPGLVDYFADVNKDQSHYYLHFALRMNDTRGLAIYPSWTNGLPKDNGQNLQEGYKVSVGPAKITVYDKVVNGMRELDLVKPISGEFKAGEWNEYEICVADFGYDFSKAEGDNPNLFVANPGTQLYLAYELDAMFYYKK